MFSSVQSHRGAHVSGAALGRRRRSAVIFWGRAVSPRRDVTPRKELVEASGKECFVGRWFLPPFIFHLYEHLNGEKEKWQPYEVLTSGSGELSSLYTDLTRILALHWCFPVIRCHSQRCIVWRECWQCRPSSLGHEVVINETLVHRQAAGRLFIATSLDGRMERELETQLFQLFYLKDEETVILRWEGTRRGQREVSRSHKVYPAQDAAHTPPCLSLQTLLSLPTLLCSWTRQRILVSAEGHQAHLYFLFDQMNAQQ